MIETGARRARFKNVGSTSLSSMAHSPTARPHSLVYIGFFIFLFFHFPAFTQQLAMDRATGAWVGSPILKFATLSSELFAILMIATSRDARALVVGMWPIWVLFAVAFASALWSVHFSRTIQNSNTSMTTALLGVALSARLPGVSGITFVVRSMATGCVLSIVWVIFSEDAVHQAGFVHAGLWKGIFSHKQGLGYFAAITAALLVFYGHRVFSFAFLIVALIASFACLIGTQSATGFVMAPITAGLFFVAYGITRFPPPTRRLLVIGVACLGLLIYLAFQNGLFNSIIVNVLGKSTDLTGRATFWTILQHNFDKSGKALLGGGFQAGFAETLYPVSVDNGYVDKLFEFGYLLSPVVFGIYGLMYWRSIKLLVKTTTESAYVNVFPVGILTVILLANTVEGTFMTKSINSVLFSVAVVVMLQARGVASRGPHQSERAVASVLRL